MAKHRVHAQAEPAPEVRALVCPPLRYAHDVVDRRNAEAMSHPRHRWQPALDRRFVALEPRMELRERVLLQDAGRSAGRVDLEPPRARGIGRGLERPRIERSHMAVDPARDDSVVRRGAVEVLTREESPLGPFRLVPIDPDDPATARRRGRDPTEALDGVRQVPSPIEPRPPALPRRLRHVCMRVDEARDHGASAEIDDSRATAAPAFRLGVRADGDQTVPPDGEGARPGPLGPRREDPPAYQDDVRVARHVTARPAGPGPARPPPGASRPSSRT